MTATIFERYSHMTARIEPSWIMTVKTRRDLRTRRVCPTSSRCAVDEIGRNSVTPCTIPSSAAARSVTPSDRELTTREPCAAISTCATAAAAQRRPSAAGCARACAPDGLLLSMIASDGAMNQPE